MLFVANFTHGRTAIHMNTAHFAGRADATERKHLREPATGHEVPAERASCALPGIISTQCTIVPTGILRNGKALPALIGASDHSQLLTNHQTARAMM